MTKVFNPSDKKGGIVKFADESAPDSVDTGDTYYGSQWNMVRLYGRSLTMFNAAPGDASNKLVGDLAEGLGKPSDGGKTWTYKIRKGVKFEDGTADHVEGRQVRRRAVHRQDRLPRRPGVLRLDARPGRPAGRARTSPRA